jgi:rod shape determining protein RodA
MMQTRNQSLSNKVDWATVLLYGALVFWGWLNIFSVTFDREANQSIFDFQLNSGKQLFLIAFSIVIILAILIIDMRFYETVAYVIYGVVMFVLVLVPFIGKEVGGNRAWLGWGSFGIQPSEFAKFATALAVAKFVSASSFKIDNLRNQMILFGVIGIPMVLILLEKDFGTAMVFIVFLLVFYREGMSPFLLLVGIGVTVIFFLTLIVENNWILYALIAASWALALYLNRKKMKLIRFLFITGVAAVLALTIISVETIFSKLKPHHQARVMVLIKPNFDQRGAGYNVYQSKVAIGSGGFAGKGFLEGTMTKLEFVPEQHTDFIFCTIGEEQGWIGSFFLIALFITLILRVIFIAERQKSRFARVYGYSVACILFFHFAVNIGMAIGLFPVIGIPLPFFSYGGSSLLGFTILLFILLKLDAHRMQVLQRL